MVNVPPFLPPSVGLARFSVAAPAKSFSVMFASPLSELVAGVPPESPLSESSPPQAPTPRTVTSAASASKVFQRDLDIQWSFLAFELLGPGSCIARTRVTSGADRGHPAARRPRG